MTIASRNADKLKDAAAAIGVTADVTNDDSVVNLFRECGPVDHVVVTAAQLRTGPFKTVAMDDVRATMEGKFWGAWRVNCVSPGIIDTPIRAGMPAAARAEMLDKIAAGLPGRRR